MIMEKALTHKRIRLVLLLLCAHTQSLWWVWWSFSNVYLLSGPSHIQHFLRMRLEFSRRGAHSREIFTQQQRLSTFYELNEWKNKTWNTNRRNNDRCVCLVRIARLGCSQSVFACFPLDSAPIEKFKIVFFSLFVHMILDLVFFFSKISQFSSNLRVQQFDLTLNFFRQFRTARWKKTYKNANF